jgi:hypothetical protein
MPSRPVSLAIIAFWLVTTGWLVGLELVQVERAAETPPYSIDLADEAIRVVASERWACTLNGRKIGNVQTAITYHNEDDTFELAATSKTLDLLDLELPIFGHVKIEAKGPDERTNGFEDRIGVTRDGILRWARTSAHLTASVRDQSVSGHFELSAQVRGGRLERSVKFTAKDMGTYELKLDPVEPPQGRVLNPMHPVPRIIGLRLGQSWRQPVADPRSDILRAALAQLAESFGGKAPRLPEPPRSVAARVLPELRTLWFNNFDTPCFVIEFTAGDDYLARTWVRAVDGAVLRQEADVHGDALVLQRE